MIFHLLLLLAIFLALANASILERHSFAPPFSLTDNAGNRKVSNFFREGGSTVVHNNFVRLTPDRQSKRGTLWSTQALYTSMNNPGMDSLNSVLKFRISGQGKNFFGDGLAMWITQHSHPHDGPIHGFTDQFVGIGIIFDTFKNTENLAAHRDVTILINDGTKNNDQLLKEIKGCNTNVRYHNDRADFSVNDASKAKIIVKDNKLTVQVDAKDTGDWFTCVDSVDLNLPMNFLSNAYIGFTATTGQLADNHDIISLKSYSDSKIMEDKEYEATLTPKFQINYNDPIETNIIQITSKLNDLINKHEVLDHHIEHELASVSDHIKSLIKKLEQREEKSENRIEQLEEIIQKHVDSKLENRLIALEKNLNKDVESKIMNIESAIDTNLKRIEVNDNNSYRLPFFIICTLFISLFLGFYILYKKLKKSYLL